MTWPAIESLKAGRVRLEPLTVDLAVPMVDVLANPAIYRFIGGRPPTLSELQRRYAAQVVGHSEDQTQWWSNWIIMLGDHPCAIGYVQATVEQSAATLEASIAWVMSPDFQGRGLATEAARDDRLADGARGRAVRRLRSSCPCRLAGGGAEVGATPNVGRRGRRDPLAVELTVTRRFPDHRAAHLGPTGGPSRCGTSAAPLAWPSAAERR